VLALGSDRHAVLRFYIYIRDVRCLVPQIHGSIEDDVRYFSKFPDILILHLKTILDLLLELGDDGLDWIGLPFFLVSSLPLLCSRNLLL
jgi:hypothetical protein